MHYDAAERTNQKKGETGWILETNKSMNRAMERMGGKIVRTYRVYEKLFEIDRRRCHHVAGMTEPLRTNRPLGWMHRRDAVSREDPGSQTLVSVEAWCGRA